MLDDVLDCDIIFPQAKSSIDFTLYFAMTYER